MTVMELLEAIADAPLDRRVVIGNVLQSPFAILPIKEVVIGEEGPIYIRAERTDK